MNLRFRNLLAAAGALCVLAAATSAGPVRISVQAATVVGGTSFTYAVYVDSSLTGLGVSAYQFELAYNTSSLIFTGIDTAGTMTGAWPNTLANEPTPGHIVVAGSGASDLSGTGTLVYLKFTAKISAYTTVSAMSFVSFVLNEGTPATTTVNANITVQVPPSIAVSPDTKILTKGDTQLFTAISAVGPVSWSSTNPTAASISTGGLLTALSPGTTRVVAVDSVGTVDSSGTIEVRGLKLSVKDTSVYQGQTLDLPITTTDVTGLGIISGELELSYNPNLWTVVDVISTGTLTAPAGTPQFATASGKLSISFAGATALSGSGVLLIVRLQASAANSGYSSVAFQNILFNEDILGNSQSGTVSVTVLPSLSVTPSGGQSLVKGDSLQFSVSGGTGPYTWSVSDSQKAHISASGLLTVLRGGSVTVTAKDSYGAIGSSGTVNLYDFRLMMPIWSQFVYAAADTVMELPITITANDTGFYAFQFKITYPTGNNIVLDSIMTSGTLAASWTVVPSFSTGNVVVAAAGTSPITSAGTLLRLRFHVPLTTPRPSTTSLTFSNVVFNEGAPIPLVTNGSLQIRSTNSKPVLSIKAPAILDSLLAGQSQTFAVTVFDPDADPVTYTWKVDGTVEQSGSSATFNRNFPTVSPATTVTVVYADPYGAKDSTSWTFKVYTITDVTVSEPGLPDRFGLAQNYPNPFNPSTTIRFSIPERAFVSLVIYDVLGNEVERLVSAPLSPGVHSVRWNAGSFANGTYFYRLQAGDLVQTKKLILLK